MTDGRTHWEDCWRHHLDCAVRRVEELERILATHVLQLELVRKKLEEESDESA